MLVVALAGCVPTSSRLTVHPPPEYLDVFEDFVAYAGHPDLRVDADAPRGRGLHVRLEEDGSLPAGSYRIDDDGGLVVTGGDVLGLQYGLAATLEDLGFRFFHPQQTRFPVEFDDPSEALADGDLVVPETARNGLQLHTLHPIEGLYDLWLPSEDGLVRSRQIVDWLVKNRGNHLQWPALDDIQGSPLTAAAWQEHTAAIVDYAHSRGVTIGIGVQLFGSGNLQRAFDLVDGDFDEAEIDARLALLAPVHPDTIVMSFGEFSGEEPAVFVENANRAVAHIASVLPGSETTTVIHVGNYDDLRIEYQGEEMLYYFLAQYVEGAKPLVHSVMYYDLFEDAGLAYLHEEFDEHRDFLLDRIKAGEPVGYFPESAYWITFDNSVPTYLPLYMRSRFTDLDRIRAEAGPLSDHTLFSSGWEWGYWQTDVATLRMAHTLPDSWDAEIRRMWSPWGEDGRKLADTIVALGELQHEALLVDRLAPYFASRDAVIDIGDSLGIVSQPDRPRFTEIAGLDEVGRANVSAAIAGLSALAAGTDALSEDAAELGGTDPWFAEVKDGIAVDALRARFVSDLYAATLVEAEGGDGEAQLAVAEAALDAARRVVARRHANLHWTGGERLVAETDENPTVYAYGYLSMADTLCYWDRERIQVANLVRGTEIDVPPCT